MRFISTRGESPPLPFSEAVATGLAPDGGLYLPETLPDLGPHLAAWQSLSYAELCAEFLGRFATDIPKAELKALAADAYSKFTAKDVAPLKDLGNGLHVLELFHGPTLAFKDFALQLLGNLYGRQCKLRNESINVLGATSGDTGAAAIHGLIGRPGTAIFILYPDGRVAPLQERQMACTGASNVFALAVDGTFDDAQASLKELFGDQAFRTGHRLSAVNSINLARVLAQCVYYLSAWLRLPAGDRDQVEFVVPTGNFGNVMAGWLLQKMGVPIGGFKVATNQNDILYRLFTSGEYRVESVHPSLAPSMDIQVASNFERFLYYSLRQDSKALKVAMQTFKATGRYHFQDFNRDTFTACRCDDLQIQEIISDTHRRYGYIVDPHTACAFKGVEKGKLQVVLSTASPAKFPEAIEEATGVHPTDPSLERLKAMPIVKIPIKADAASIRSFIELHAV